MPWGALFLPLFTLLLGLWFLAIEFTRLTGRPVALLRGIAPACALVAIGLLLYTGREVSVVRARPIWFSYGFPIVMFLSALQASWPCCCWRCANGPACRRCWRAGHC